MKITKLTLCNFRSFYGEQVINFGDKNVIYAQNGTGKSNILYALYWLMYGKGGTDKVDMPKNQPLINKIAENEGLDVNVSIDIEYNNRRYKLTRKAEKGDDEGKLEIYENYHGSSHPYNSVPADLFVNSIIPLVLMPYFFFEGEERIKSYMSNKNLGIFINQILGEETYKKTDRLLKKARSELDKKLSVASNTQNNTIDEKNTLDDDINILSQDCETLDRKIYQLKEECKGIKEKLKQIDISKEIEKRKDDLEKQQKILDKDTKMLRTNLIQYFTAQTNLMLAKPILEKLEDLNDDYYLPAPYGEILLNKIQNDKECICGREVKLNSPEYNAIEKNKENAVSVKQTERLHAIKALQHNIKNKYDDILSKHNDNNQKFDMKLSDSENNAEALKQVQQDLRKIDNSEVQNLTQRQDDINEEISEIQIQLHDKKQQLKEKKQLRKKLDAEIKRMRDRAKGLDADKIKHQIYILEKSIKWLQSEKERELEKSRNFVKNTMNRGLKEYFRHNWSINISDNWEIIVQDAEGDLMDLSGGQNQFLGVLFATSLVNLAKNGGNRVLKSVSVPLVLDSIYGKLDGGTSADTEGYQEKVTKFIFELGEQVILLVSSSQGVHMNKMDDINALINKRYFVTAYADNVEKPEIMNINGIECTLIESAKDKTYSEIKEVR